MKFKTNIKCGGCIQTVRPFLEGLKEIKNWQVDLASPDRILSVDGDVTPEKVIQAIQAAGYRAELLS
jgi:copper chaperone